MGSSTATKGTYKGKETKVSEREKMEASKWNTEASKRETPVQLGRDRVVCSFMVVGKL